MNANANVGVNRANRVNLNRRIYGANRLNRVNLTNPSNLNHANCLNPNSPPPYRISTIKKIAKLLRNIGAVDNASYKRGGVFRVRLISAKADMKH